MSKVKTIIALVIFLSALGVIAYFFLHPVAADHHIKKQVEGTDLLKLHEKYPDVIGWIKVEGTNINYPVMIGEQYLYRTMKGEYDASGTPFVEDDWSPQDRVTIVYGHNMWAHKTMFNALHKFEEEKFFRENKDIIFYAICGDETPYVEKRLFEATHCILTDVSQWNYSEAQYIEDDIELKAFLEECGEKSLYKSELYPIPEKMILLSTCSYHISGRDGRTVITGKFVSMSEDSIIPKTKTKKKE